MLFLLWLHVFILSGVISPLFSSSILGIYRPWEFIFLCHMFLPFHTLHEVLKARILKWFAIPFSSGPRFVTPLHMTHLGWPYMAWLNFTELDKAVVHVIRSASCLWLWLPSICPLMPSLSAYHLTWVSLTLDLSISSWLLQQSAATAPFLERGVAPLYPMSKVRSCGCALLEQPWRDTPYSR